MKNEADRAAPKWLRLDNTANLYLATRRRNWSSLFRYSATLNEDADPEILQQAVYRVTVRFPAFSVRLRRGAFWHFLQHIEGGPQVRPDGSCPCEPLRPEENDGFCFRVSYYNRRISVDFFHALTDGMGALSFFKTLLAEYLTLKYGVLIPRDGIILDCGDSPKPEEYEDSFQKYAGIHSRVPKEGRSYRVRGTKEPDGFINLVCGMIPADVLKECAREKGVSVTQYLTAALMLAIIRVQQNEVKLPSRYVPVKVLVPVNLRYYFPSVTTRNFIGITTPGIDPRMGDYSLDEVLSIVYHYMGTEVTEKNLQARFTSYVRTQRNPVVRPVPLFIKNPTLKLANMIAGDSRSSTTMSNLGMTGLPPEMEPYVPRLEVIIGPLHRNPVAFSVITYRGTVYINSTRRIRSPKVEREFYTTLVKQGIPVKIESNRRTSNSTANI